jgi:hypothetical protein
VSEIGTIGVVEHKPLSSPAAPWSIGSVKVARYTINAGLTRGGSLSFLANTTVQLNGPPLRPGDLILNVLTDCLEVFGDADSGDNTTLQIRFNDGSTQTNIQAATSIGGAPFSTVSRVLMIQDWATVGDWLKLTLNTWIEVLVSNDQNIDDGLMDIYVFYISGD